METSHPASGAKDDPTIWRVDDALWAPIEPILRSDKPRTKPARPRRDDRAIFDGPIRLVRTGGQWQRCRGSSAPSRPPTPGSGSGHRRGRCRARAVLLAESDGELGRAWEWQATDGRIVKASLGKRGLPARRRRRAATPPTAASPAPSAMC